MSISVRLIWCLGSRPKHSKSWRRWKTSASFPARNMKTSSGPLRRTEGWPRAEIRSQRELTSLFTAGVPRGAVSHGVSDEMLRTLVAPVHDSFVGTFWDSRDSQTMSGVGVQNGLNDMEAEPLFDHFLCA